MIHAQNLSVRSPDQTAVLLNNIDLQINTPGLHGICGPNGAGKTTLLRTFCGLHRAFSGGISVNGVDPYQMSTLRRAGLIAWVPAVEPTSFGYRVYEVVSWGRWASHQGRPSNEDRKYIDEAISLMQIEHLRDRALTTLSLGEQKRVQLARALASQTPILIMDEPLSSLDIGVSLDVLKVLQDLVKYSHRMIVASFHDLSLAYQYADSIALLHRGTLIDHGNPEQVFSSENLATIYRVQPKFITQDEQKLMFLSRKK